MVTRDHYCYFPHIRCGKGAKREELIFHSSSKEESLLHEKGLKYVHNIEADMSVCVCVFAEPASSVLQRAPARNSHA